MPVTFELIENGRALKYTLIQPWTMAEVMAHQAHELALRDQSETPLPTIIDVTQMGNLAAGVIGAYRLPGLKHPRLGEFLVVGGSAFLKTFSEMLLRFASNNPLYFFTTLEAALAHLHVQWQMDTPRDTTLKQT